MLTVLATEDEIKAEAEAWHKTHYRSEWFLLHTVGYAVLASILVTYVFWDATHTRGAAGDAIWLWSLIWIVLLSAGLMAYDYRTRRSQETLGSILGRAHK